MLAPEEIEKLLSRIHNPLINQFDIQQYMQGDIAVSSLISTAANKLLEHYHNSIFLPALQQVLELSIELSTNRIIKVLKEEYENMPLAVNSPEELEKKVAEIRLEKGW